MSIKLGNTSIGSLYLGSTKVSAAYLGNVKVYEAAPVLPSYTMRLKFTEGVTPTFTHGGSAVQVSASPNVWDFTYVNTSWQQVFEKSQDLIAVIGANIVGVTNLTATFHECSNLADLALFDTSTVTTFSSTFRMSGIRTLPLFDTSNATSLARICQDCHELGGPIPLLNTSKVTNVRYAFYECPWVESGALALYNQMISQSVPPTTYEWCFGCGGYTPPDTPIHAERAQIPESWGGTMA